MHYLSRNLCKPETGDVFMVNDDEYVLGGKIGDGAAGLVRKAMRKKDNVQHAIKFLAPDPKYIEEAKFDDVAARFRREGQRGVALKYEHLLSIYNFCENEAGCCFENKKVKNPFIVMEFVNGRTLEDYILKYRIENKEFSINRKRLHIAIQVACALEDLHKKHLVHRDVKPANIFIARETGEYPIVKLGDFGIMKWGDFQASITTGTLTTMQHPGLGTLKYMSPEQATSPKDVTVRSDIYSLGITLFELFALKIHATHHHVTEVMLARLNKGNGWSRLLSMRYEVSLDDNDIASLILDMHLRGAKGRPQIMKVRGILEYEYERRYDADWRSDCDGY